MKNKVIVIMGPTASGKSDIAIKLAQKFNSEILSADSRQIYRHMNVGTGKVPRDSSSPHLGRGIKGEGLVKKAYYSAGIPHYMIDIANPKTDYNVAKFKKSADKIIADILRRGKLPIICGGTGFWINAVVDNVVFPEVKPDKALRKKLQNKSAKELFKLLKNMDSQRAETIDKNNKVRLIRAIEIAKVLGKVPTPPAPSPYQGEGWGRVEFLQIGLDAPKKKLHQNIKKRLEKRWQQGMIKEVQKLHAQGLSWQKIQSFGLGYFWIPLYLQKKIAKKELYEKVYQAEKDYSKRQMTWFRKDKSIIWLKNYKKIESETKKFIKK